MSGVVLLAPHHDDETLFAGFLALAHQPDLIVCTRADVQQERGLPITHDMRARETDDAWAILAPGRDWVQWHNSEAHTDWEALDRQVAELAGIYQRVIAPAFEEGGHHHHNGVANAVARYFTPDRVLSYLTYTREHGRSTGGVEVAIGHPDWIAEKLRALACYTSQIREPSTRPWFLGPLTEYRA